MSNVLSRLKKPISILVAITMALSVVAANVPSLAFAQETAYLSVGARINYGDYSTHRYSINGTEAYCAQPAKKSPRPGSYAIDENLRPDVANLLWHCYGAPGFNPSEWPATYYGGQAWTPDRYRAISHIMIADVFSYDFSAAVKGMPPGFIHWIRQHFIDNRNDETFRFKYTRKHFDAPHKSIFRVFAMRTGSATQVMIGFSYNPYGSLELQKHSSNPDCTNGNALYSLEGAEYGVFEGSNKVATLVTNAQGYAKASELRPGNYTVKETKAPKGYMLDERTYNVTVNPGGTAKVNGGSVTDTPINDPMFLLLGKFDGNRTYNGEKNLPQGAASLEGAEFTVKYYDQFSDNPQGEPKRTWVFKTDADGYIDLKPSYKVAGDALYETPNGNEMIPRGTITIQETKAPKGYVIDNTVHVQQIKKEGDTSLVSTYNAPEIPNTVERGDYGLIKAFEKQSETNAEATGKFGNILLEGIEFDLINDNENSVISPDGREVARGEVVCTITSDASGIATTKALNKPEGWTGALAYGTYIVKERVPEAVKDKYKALYGVDIATEYDWKTTITKDKQDDPYTLVTNKPAQTPLRILKVDAETGKTIPLECSFKIYDAQENLVTYKDFTQNDKVVDTWTTNGDGICSLPMKLIGGTYTIKELHAPEGYVLDSQGMTFEVNDYRTWDNPLVVTYKNAPIKGKVVITKFDRDTKEKLNGAYFKLIAASDIVTGDGTVRVHKDEVAAQGEVKNDGVLSFEGLYLGSYKLIETKPALGYGLDNKVYDVSLTSEGELVPVVTTSQDVPNTPTSLKVKKIDSSTLEPLAGVAFKLEGDALDEAKEVTTDENGELFFNYLHPGQYSLTELKAPFGYILDKARYQFVVNDKGQVVTEDNTCALEASLEIINKPIGLRTTALVGDTHVTTPNKHTKIVDRLSFENLVIGKTYKARGYILDKTTNKPLEVEGKRIEAESVFVAEEGLPDVEVTLEADTSRLAGHKLVLMEELYELDDEGNEVLVAEHKDIEDTNQTITIKPPLVRTGDAPALIPVLIAGLAAGVIIRRLTVKNNN